MERKPVFLRIFLKKKMSNICRFLKPKEIEMLLHGYLRSKMSDEIMMIFVDLIKDFYFPNEDIKLKIGSIITITSNLSHVYSDTLLTKWIQSVDKGSTFKLLYPILFTKNTDFCSYICVMPTNIIKKRVYGSNILNDYKKPVFIPIERTNAFSTKASKFNDYKMFRDINSRNNIVLSDKIIGKVVKRYVKPKNSIKELWESKFSSDNSVFGQRFQLVEPKILGNNYLDNCPLYVYFNDLNKYGWLLLQQTDLKYLLCLKEMENLGIDVTNMKDTELKNTVITLDEDSINGDEFIIDQSAQFGGFIDLFNANEAQYIEIILLSKNVYYDRFGSSRIAVHCIPSRSIPLITESKISQLFGKSVYITKYQIKPLMNSDILNDPMLCDYIQEWNININNIKVTTYNDLTEINTGIIISETTGFTNLYDHKYIGAFFKGNSFKLMDSKIYERFNRKYIKVKLIIKKNIYYQDIDFKLQNEMVYIDIGKTNLWKYDNNYIKYIKLIQEFKHKHTNNILNIDKYPKSRIIASNPVRLNYSFNNNTHKNCGWLTSNDEIYLIAPTYNDINYGHTICVYSKNLHKLGWIKASQTAFKRENTIINQTISNTKIEDLIENQHATSYVYVRIYSCIEPFLESLGYFRSKKIKKLVVYVIEKKRINNENYTNVMCVDKDSIHYNTSFWVKFIVRNIV